MSNFGPAGAVEGTRLGLRAIPQRPPFFHALDPLLHHVPLSGPGDGFQRVIFERARDPRPMDF